MCSYVAYLSHSMCCEGLYSHVFAAFDYFPSSYPLSPLIQPSKPYNQAKTSHQDVHNPQSYYRQDTPSSITTDTHHRGVQALQPSPAEVPAPSPSLPDIFTSPAPPASANARKARRTTKPPIKLYKFKVRTPHRTPTVQRQPYGLMVWHPLD